MVKQKSGFINVCMVINRPETWFRVQMFLNAVPRHFLEQLKNLSIEITET